MDVTELPRTQVHRILRTILPSGFQTNADSKLAINKSTTMFVLYLTEAAAHLASKAGRQGINESDVLRALEELEFDDFVDGLRKDLEQYNVAKAAKKSAKEMLSKEQQSLDAAQAAAAETTKAEAE